MDEAEDVVEKLLRQAVVNQRNDYDSHPEPEQLVALAEGHCNAQEAESLRDHLANCSECTQLLLDFKDFEEGNLVPEAAALTDDDIKSRREELFTATTDFPQGRVPFYRRLSFAYGLAATFLLMALFSWVTSRTDPITYPSYFMLKNDQEVFRGGEPTLVEAPMNTPVSLAFFCAQATDNKEYRIFLSHNKGSLIHSASRIPRNQYLSINLRANTIDNGDYVVEVFDQENRLASYSFRFIEIPRSSSAR